MDGDKETEYNSSINIYAALLVRYVIQLMDPVRALALP